MMTIEAWLGQYLDICRELLATLSADSGHYSDEKLASVEAALDLRREMLDELAGLEIGDEERQLYSSCSETLNALESEIELAVKAMMAEVKAERLAVHDKRTELNRLHRANRSYVGKVQSTEGYFIDKKK